MKRFGFNTDDQNEKSNRKTIKRFSMIFIAFSLIIAVIFSAQTFAFFTDRVVSDNSVIKTGTVNVKILSFMGSGSSQTAVIDPFEIMPSAVVEQSATVKNDGSLPLYVRFKVQLSIVTEGATPSDWESLVTLNYNTALWTLKDGYYYYAHPLLSGETASYLFTNVTFSPEMGNEYQNCNITLKLTAEATQSNNNGNDATEALGWPASN